MHKQVCDEITKYKNIFLKELIKKISEGIDAEETKKFETILTPKARVFYSRVITNLEEH